MTADVRTFKAASMQEALDVVRREMGPDAVILHTRELTPPRLLSFLRSKDRVEITAGLETEPRHNENKLASAGNNASSRNRSQNSSTNLLPPKSSGSHRTRELLDEEELPPAPRNRLESPAAPPRSRAGRDSDLAEPPSLLPPTKSASRPAPRNLPIAEELKPSQIAPRRSVPSAPMTPQGRDPLTDDRAADQTDYTLENLIPRVAPPPRQPRPQTPVAPRPDQSAISEQLAGIRQIVERLGHKVTPAPVEQIPALWTEVAEHLHDLGIEERLAQEWIQRLSRSNDLSPRDRDLIDSRLQTYIEADLKCAGPIQVQAGQRRVVALVGPTGVGKTTTVAKLAAHYHLREGLNTGLITIDTFRIAAVEQLRTYAQIIDLPMQVATNPNEFRQALHQFRDLDLVLIDTAGRSPRDADRIQQLKELLRHGEVHEIHLVLSLVAGQRSLINTIDRFATAGVTSLILSKLDEAPDLSNIVGIARYSPWPFTYITTGQEVPDDFAVARKSHLAQVILGLDSLTPQSSDSTP